MVGGFNEFKSVCRPGNLTDKGKRRIVSKNPGYIIVLLVRNKYWKKYWDVTACPFNTEPFGQFD
jgi:hypothetical protein